MKESTKDKLISVVNKFIEVQPEKYTKHPSYYMYYLEKDIRESELREDAVLYACKVFFEKELWDKSLAYFKAIIIGEDQNIQMKITKERRLMGGIPKDVA